MKRTLAILLSIAILCCGLPALAHDHQCDHNKDLKQVLFGDRDCSLRGETEKAFKAIADAASLCIDQFTTRDSAPSKKKEFDDLSRRVYLSMRFEKIDLKKDKFGNGISSSTHRWYTHLGWSNSSNSDPKFWQKRKKILLETVQQELFGSTNPIIDWVTYKINSLAGPSKQCEAFCEMVYYVHLLGDHVVGDKPSTLAALVPLVRPNDPSNPGIIPELKKCLQVLFEDQKTTMTFMSFMQDLDVLRMKAEEVCSSWGGINTEEKCATNMKNAEELLKLLGAYVPELLKNEDFFTQIFPIS